MRGKPLSLLLVDQAAQCQVIGAIAVAMRVRPRLSPSASDPAIRIWLSAAVSPVRRWVKQSGNNVQVATSASAGRSVMRMRGNMA